MKSGIGIALALTALTTQAPFAHATTSKGLSGDQIDKVVRSHGGQIRACYSRELERTPGLEGQITIKWTINAKGNVTSAKVHKTTMNNSRVEDCIVREVQRMKFPKPEGGNKAVVKYPFGFSKQS